MYKAILCLGSNLNPKDAEWNIDFATKKLQLEISILASSAIYPSSSGYMNQVVTCTTTCNYEQLHEYTKRLEYSLGRRKAHKDQGIVPIDIDIVVFDDEVKRPLDYCSAYFKQGIQEINS